MESKDWFIVRANLLDWAARLTGQSLRDTFWLKIIIIIVIIIIIIMCQDSGDVDHPEKHKSK
jgi:uncharacterized membrane protein YhaH (DUF805 family)